MRAETAEIERVVASVLVIPSLNTDSLEMAEKPTRSVVVVETSLTSLDLILLAQKYRGNYFFGIVDPFPASVERC